MANGNGTTVRNSDLLTWQIAGIRAERERTESRLAYLKAQEAALVGQGLIGTNKTSTTKGKAAKATPLKKRTRNFSPETRKRMAEAQRKRWAERQGKTTTGAVNAAPQTEQSIPEPVA